MARKKLRWQELLGPEEDGAGGTRRIAKSGGDHRPVVPLELAKERSPTRSSKGRSPVGRNSVRVGKSSPAARRSAKEPSFEAQPAVESAHMLAERLGAWEKQLKSNGHVCRALSRCSLWTVDLEANALGVPWIARPEEQTIVGYRSVCAGLRSASVQMISAYPSTAKSLRVNERLWMNWYREIGKLQAQSRLSPSGQPTRQELSDVLASCSKFYSELVRQLQTLMRKPRLTMEHREGIQYSLQLALVALGDVARYSQSQLEKHEPRDWALAKKYYHDALQVAPSNGKVYNQLGLLAMLERKLLEGAYAYARSLACEHPFAGRDNFVHALRRGKSSGTKQQQHMEIPVCQALKTYSSLALSCQHLLLTGEEFELMWSAELERMRVALCHLLDMFDLQNKEETLDGSSDSQTEMLSAALIHSVCVTIVLAHDAQHSIGEASSRQDFEQAFVDRRVSFATTKALELVSITAQCILAKLVAVLSELAESAQVKRLANALLPPVNITLDWLHAHPVLLDGSHPAIRAFQGRCVDMFNTLSARGFVSRRLYCSSKRGDLSGVALPEDRELKGFLPCEKAFQKRFQQEKSREKNLSRSLTNEELLVLRAVRFMKLSESFVLPTHSSAPSPSAYPSSRRHTSPAEEVVPEADPFAVDPVQCGRLCALCSNTSTFGDGMCEFCGYEDNCEDGVLLDNGLDTAEQAPESSWGSPDAITTSQVPSPEKERGPERKSPRPRYATARPSSSFETKSPPTASESDFTTIMSIGAEHTAFQDGLDANARHQRLIVVDAPNVAMRHGKGKLFSCIGVELAVRYFQELGHRVVAFIPDYMLQSDEERAQRQEQGAVLTAAKIPDNVALLERLVQDGLLIPTPSQDYDDSYCIQYAGLHDGFVVTNDLFRDHVANMVGPRERKEAMRVWLRAHQISYSWVRNEFLPNPNFRFPEVSPSKF